MDYDDDEEAPSYWEQDDADDAEATLPEPEESPVESDHEPEEVDNQSIQAECLELFGSKDFIMEPGISPFLQRYFQAGGGPEPVVQLLSDNYSAIAQLANLLAEWLIMIGVNISEVQKIVEDHMKKMIIRNFDQKKADSIFTEEGQTPTWLTEMIEYPEWRSLFYQLAEVYPDCLMLNFTVKLISDAGFQDEIKSVSTVCQQIEVFSRVLKTSVCSFLEKGEEHMKEHLPEFTNMVCHGEHTYLYTQALLSILAQESKGGSHLKRLCQEINKCATEKGHDVTPVTLALSGSASYPRACGALSAMLSKNALNPADVTVLFKMYSSNDPPPVDLIRTPQLIELLTEALFCPNSRVNPDHKSKYIYLLAYSASVHETHKKGVRKSINRDELKQTSQAIEKVSGIIFENKSCSDLICEVATLYQCIRFPVVGMGVIRWVEHAVNDPSYFQHNIDHTPLHIALLDEVSTCHPMLHPRILELLISLFESEFKELDVLVQLELKKVILDRTVHLLSRGFVIPVINYLKQCWEVKDTDVSLIRHFVSEVLDVIAPPFTLEFVQLFLPLIENENITGSIRTENEHDPVSEFIAHCRQTFDDL
ncbi:PREDICTED: negative elongation factor D-like [Priapulus caudatus]|uniref:Negative elongation factor D-like n=1 Tax=Priapulus caudatus TaxID=37621 RepID=A0ABM1E191_PRICU|nr:PREDICTED: negative elongation factor D-like [Priapulus caudatus]XP_014665963.1 PREDICTED: negative elongation factor D-like [Priapulus caudatus]XP_014665964.1 PREDICTED: negative elongation factor D-like [Priapulus caudatus]